MLILFAILRTTTFVYRFKRESFKRFWSYKLSSHRKDPNNETYNFSCYFKPCLDEVVPEGNSSRWQRGDALGRVHQCGFNWAWRCPDGGPGHGAWRTCVAAGTMTGWVNSYIVKTIINTRDIPYRPTLPDASPGSGHCLVAFMRLCRQFSGGILVRRRQHYCKYRVTWSRRTIRFKDLAALLLKITAMVRTVIWRCRSFSGPTETLYV